MEMLREKIRGLELKIVEMIRNGQDNVAIADRLHRWTRALMITADAAMLTEVLVRELKQQFLIPQAGIRVWGVAEAYRQAPFAQGASDDIKILATSLGLPYCGANAGFEAARWLDEPATVASMAMVPLRASGADALQEVGAHVGPVARRIGAADDQKAESRIGEIASAGLARLLPSA